LKKGHRSAEFNGLIVPQSQLGIEAIGHALAYSQALKDGLPKPILDVYETIVIHQDPTWFAENVGLGRHKQKLHEDAALNSFIPKLNTYLDQLDIAEYVTVPIISDRAWKAYYAGLRTLKGNATPEAEIYGVPPAVQASL